WDKYKSENEHFVNLLYCYEMGTYLGRDDSPRTIQELDKFGPLAISASRNVAKLVITAKDPNMRVAGLRTLAKIGPGAAIYSDDAIDRSLDDSDGRVKRQALETINSFGPDANLSKQLRKLVKVMLTDPDSAIRDG